MRSLLKRFPVLVLGLLFLSASVLLAQAVGVTPPVSAPASLADKIEHILVVAGGIFALIEGLKNLPFTAGLFASYPSLAVILNAVGALIAAMTTCFSGGIDFQCILTAVGTFIAAAGIHNVKTSLSTAGTK